VNNLPIFILIRSEYFTVDASRYRLGISEMTSIPSLRLQMDKDFTLVLDMCPMDPRWSMRLRAFESIGVPVIPMHEYTEEYQYSMRVEIELQDDDFYSPELIEKVRSGSQRGIANMKLLVPDGYLFCNGELRHTTRHSLVNIHMIREPHTKSGSFTRIAHSPMWVHVRHRMNYTVTNQDDLFNAVIPSLNWRGWNHHLVTKYSEMEIKTGTAVGAKESIYRRKIVFKKKASRR